MPSIPQAHRRRQQGERLNINKVMEREITGRFNGWTEEEKKRFYEAAGYKTVTIDENTTQFPNGTEQKQNTTTMSRTVHTQL